MDGWMDGWREVRKKGRNEKRETVRAGGLKGMSVKGEGE